MKIKLFLLVGFLTSICGASESKYSFQEIFNSFSNNSPEIKLIDSKIELQKKLAYAEKGLSPSEINFETLNFGMDQFIFMIGQEFELGGLKGKRAETILKEIEVLESELKVLKLNAEKKIGSLFLQALAYQEKISFLDSLDNNMTSSLAWIEKSIEIGSGSILDSMRMKLELKDIRFVKGQYQKEYSALINQLNVLCYTEIPQDSKLSFSIEELSSIEFGQEPSSSVLEDVLEKKVLVEQYRVKEIEQPFISALNVEGGISRDNTSREASALINVGLSIPLFTRNQSKVDAQKLQVKIAQREKEQITTEVNESKMAILNQLLIIKSELNFLENELIPGNENVLNEMYRLIENGDFSFIDFQQSRRELIKLKERKYELLTQLGVALLNLKIYNGEEKNVFQ